MKIEIAIGDAFMFLGTLIAHQITEITSGTRNSIDLFAHKSVYDVLNRADTIAGKAKFGKKEKKQRMEEGLKAKKKKHSAKRKEILKGKRKRQRVQNDDRGKCSG